MDSRLHDELDEMGVRHWWYRGRRTVLRAVFATHLPPVADRQILEVGAGTGSVTTVLTELGTVVAVEPHEVARAACERHAPAATVVAGGVDDLDRLPGVAGRRFDLVGAFDVIEHLSDDVGALEAMADHLADDGRLVVTVPALELLWGPHDEVNGHFRRYSRALLVRTLDRAGLQVDQVSYFNTLLFPPVALVRLARRLVPSRHEEPASDFVLPRPIVNRALTALFGLEARVLARRSLPIGSSLVAVARRKADP